MNKHVAEKIEENAEIFIRCIELMQAHFSQVWSETGQTKTAQEFYQLTLALFHTIVPTAGDVEATQRNADLIVSAMRLLKPSPEEIHSAAVGDKSDHSAGCYLCDGLDAIMPVQIRGKFRLVCRPCRDSVLGGSDTEMWREPDSPPASSEDEEKIRFTPEGKFDPFTVNRDGVACQVCEEIGSDTVFLPSRRVRATLVVCDKCIARAYHSVLTAREEDEGKRPDDQTQGAEDQRVSYTEGSAHQEKVYSSESAHWKHGAPVYYADTVGHIHADWQAGDFHSLPEVRIDHYDRSLGPGLAYLMSQKSITENLLKPTYREALVDLMNTLTHLIEEQREYKYCLEARQTAVHNELRIREKADTKRTEQAERDAKAAADREKRTAGQKAEAVRIEISKSQEVSDDKRADKRNAGEKGGGAERNKRESAEAKGAGGA